MRGTGVGIGQPIVFQFTHPVTNKAEVQKHLRISNNGEFVHENPDSVSAQGGSNVS
ncbi:MAG: Ig-like domain-containing protein, partial [Sciscionella sp.]